LLPQASTLFEQRVGDLENLDVSIFDFLGVNEATLKSLPRAALEYVCRKSAEAARLTTFNEFLDSSYCLRTGDKTTKQYRQRVAAARVSKWLERLLLGGQSALVDAPHLVMRFPSLLEGSPKMALLNKTARFCPASELPIRCDLLNEYAFAKQHWLSRPAWFWETLKDAPEIDEVRNPWSRKDVPFRFCEDASAFYSPKYCHEFVANLPSPFTRRFVRRFEDIEYVPQLRFSM